MSEALTTLGWVTNVSQHPARRRARAPPSPLWPPSAAPMPVGMIRATLNFSPAATGRFRKEKIEGKAGSEELEAPPIVPSSQRQRSPADSVTTKRIGASPGSSLAATISRRPCNGFSAGRSRTSILRSVRCMTSSGATPEVAEIVLPDLLQLSRSTHEIDGGKVDAVEHLRFHQRVGADTRECDQGADLQRCRETILSEEISSQAASSRDQVFVRGVRSGTDDGGPVLVLEDLRQVVHGRIQYGDLLSVVLEDVQDRGDEKARIRDEGLARLEEDLEAHLPGEQVRGLHQWREVFDLVVLIPSAQIDPPESGQEGLELLDEAEGRLENGSRGPRLAVGMDVDARDPGQGSRVAPRDLDELLDGYPQLRVSTAGIVTFVPHEGEPRIDPQTVVDRLVGPRGGEARPLIQGVEADVIDVPCQLPALPRRKRGAGEMDGAVAVQDGARQPRLEEGADGEAIHPAAQELEDVGAGAGLDGVEDLAPAVATQRLQAARRGQEPLFLVDEGGRGERKFHRDRRHGRGSRCSW